ncbi:MAG TPA: sigma-70 family RNA polymerase sigma factor [Aridibacter sp.]|nr:sigma-70 family RNA polymerase sigma factor [Aridibacter sp.]
MPGLFKSKKDEERLLGIFEQEAMPLTPDLFRVAMYLKRDRDLAEDLVQETMMQALKSFHRYEPGTNCKAWLTTIMYNTHYKQLRKQSNMQVVDDPEEKIMQTLAFEPSIPQKLTDDEIIEAVKKVPPIFRDVILLCDVEDFSYKEISSMLDIPMGTVMSRLHRGRKVLRGELAVVARDYGIGEEPPKSNVASIYSKGGKS